MSNGSDGLAAQLTQLAPLAARILVGLKPLVDQPVIRFPYCMPGRSTVVPAGTYGQRVPDSDFSHSLEWPFEVRKVKFSQDPAHTFRDWQVNIKDQTFNQDWMKASAMVATLIDDNTGVWSLEFPWIVRPKGGGLTVSLDNLDANNPITCNVTFEGYLLIPRT